jgi:predicted nucleic acid-binding protein
MDEPPIAVIEARRAPGGSLQCWVKSNTRRGSKSGVLPDFFIGAHAAITGIPLLTRDVSRYRTYFPLLELIAPE